MINEVSSRTRVRQWVREQIEGREEVRIPDLAQDAVQAFRKDTKFLRQLAEESLRAMVYDLAQRTVEQTRGMWIAGDDIVTKEAIKKRANSHSVFRDWLEHVGDKHVRLLDMTREDLFVAADEREKRGQHEIELAALWRTLAQRLEGGETVGSKYTVDEIESMRRGISNA